MKQKVLLNPKLFNEKLFQYVYRDLHIHVTII